MPDQVPAEAKTGREAPLVGRITNEHCLLRRNRRRRALGRRHTGNHFLHFAARGRTDTSGSGLAACSVPRWRRRCRIIKKRHIGMLEKILRAVSHGRSGAGSSRIRCSNRIIAVFPALLLRHRLEIGRSGGQSGFQLVYTHRIARRNKGAGVRACAETVESYQRLSAQYY
jgi:hypothetical protein